MRPLYHSFCFCCSLRTGAVIVAVLNMLAAGFMLFVDGMYLDNFDHNFDMTHSSIMDDDTALQYNLEKVLVWMDLLLETVSFGFAILLLLGALKGKQKLVMAWVVCASVYYAFYISRAVGLMLSGWVMWFSASEPFVALVSVIFIYCIVAMLKFCQELRETMPRNTPTPYTKSALEPHFERI